MLQTSKVLSIWTALAVIALTGAQNPSESGVESHVIELTDQTPTQLIQSPGFPTEPYPKNYSANYELRVNLSERVEQLSSRLRIKLEYIGVEPSDYCLDSNLKIILPKGELRIFCGLHTGKSMVSEEPNTRIEFRGNDKEIDKGYKLTAELIKSKCSRKFVNETEGVIQSVNYPNNYGEDETCVWEVIVAEGKFVKLEFEDDFDIKTSANICSEDYLLVSKSGDLDTDVTRFCGNDKPEAPIVSHSNRMLIKFNSDGFQTGKGFRARFVEHDRPEAAPERLPMLTPPGCACGKENLNRVKRIVGGQEVDPPHRYPWMVSIVRSNNNRSFCGAALINNYYVLTAAHCVNEATADSIGIRIGQHSLQEPTPMRKVSQIVKHENYDPVSQFNDIALIKLKDPVQYNDDILPVCLPPSDVDEPDNMWVAGWGRLEEGGRPSDTLREVYLPEYDLARCQARYEGLVTNKQLCVGGLAGHDACQGDSGGPLASRFDDRVNLVGVVSWGIGCARQNYPGVYSRVTYFLPWIEEHTRDAQYCLPPDNSNTNNTIEDRPDQPNFDDCGIPNHKLAKRVVGGTETSPQEFPWTVVIALDGQLIGSGSLIAPNVVLTAASRLKSVYNQKANIKVLVGAHDITKSEASKRVYLVNQIVIHPQFGYNAPYDYDFALLELKPSDGGFLPVRPVCLPQRTTPYTVNSPVIGAGWGRTSTYSQGSNTLQKVTLYLTDRSVCTQSYRYSVTNAMVCATDDNKDMCLGDNGAPLMYYKNGRMYLFGVFSWQSSDGCNTGQPSVFADVRYALPWISQVTNNGIRTA